MRITGQYKTIANTTYFIPYPLPPENPPFTLNAQMLELYGEAMLELGRLNEMANRLPNRDRFIKAYVIKEALLSSSIEGINTTLYDVFTQPLSQQNRDKNTQMVMNYTRALSDALSMIRKSNMPLTSRILLKAHETLMQMGDGDKANPGNYRRLAVRVGNLVPPPANHLSDLMADLEKFMNDTQELPALITAGLAHVQFETIHPFLDGNGRIGRLLIILLLVERAVLAEPIMYISYYFKKHHMEYYERLDKVRTHGDFEGWISFYLHAIKCSCIDAHRRAKDIEALEKDLNDLIIHEKKYTLAMRDLRFHALSLLFSYPVISIGQLSKHLAVSYNTAHRIIKNFVKCGFLVKDVQKNRTKIFKFKGYLDILDRVY